MGQEITTPVLGAQEALGSNPGTRLKSNLVTGVPLSFLPCLGKPVHILVTPSVESKG
jgi:hypothetical protein